MRAVLLLVVIASCASNTSRPPTPAAVPPPATSPPTIVAAPVPPLGPAADPAVLEARLRAALGKDPRTICADEVHIHVTGDAAVDRMISGARASATELETLRAFFPAIAPGARLRCGTDWTCSVTLDPKAEFPREFDYRFASEAPPKIAELWLQVITGP